MMLQEIDARVRNVANEKNSNIDNLDNDNRHENDKKNYLNNKKVAIM